MAEHVDVCIVGSGFGGSIAAWRLAELYEAAEESPSVVVLERGKRLGHTDFKQSMDTANLTNSYGLIQGQGCQVVLGNLVGGGSNLYLAASLRAPSETFERTDVHPEDPPRRRVWPEKLSRKSLDRYYRRAERALRVRQPGWDEVSKSGGIWAAMLRESGYTCDRVPLAINQERCVDAKWCYTGCVFGAKNSVITNYLSAAERKGVEVRPLMQVNQVAPSSATPYRWTVQGNIVNPETKASAGAFEDIQAKVVILCAGAMGTPPILMRSQLLGGMTQLSPHLGRHLGMNGDHVAAIEVSDRAVRDVLNLPGYADFHKGKPITTMSYDFWVGKKGHEHDGTRFTLQEILLSQFTNFLYDDGRSPATSRPGGASRRSARSPRGTATSRSSRWSRTRTTAASLRSRPTAAGTCSPMAGRSGSGSSTTRSPTHSAQVRADADAAIARSASGAASASSSSCPRRTASTRRTRSAGRAWRTTSAFGVVGDNCEVHNYEGLFCMDSSVIPSSLGVNPSLTISAVCERAAAKLIRRSEDHGLPKRPKDFKHRHRPST